MTAKAPSRKGVKQSLSSAALWFAKKWPSLSKLALRLWVKTYLWFPRPPRWLLLRMAESINCRIPVEGKLLNGLRIKVVWNDDIGREIYYQGCYEPRTIEVFRKILKPGMIFLDVGAHCGEFTLFASQIVGAEGEVHSFEPDSDTFRLLSESVHLNGLKNVRLNQSAVSDEDATKQFYQSTPNGIGGGCLQPLDEFQRGHAMQVACTRLDTYMKAKVLKRADVMKMDIEGAEINALKGAEALLATDGKPIILLEFNEFALSAFGGSCRKLAEELLSRGYVLFRIKDLGLQAFSKVEERQTSNCLALPAAREDAILAALSAKFAPTPLGDYLEPLPANLSDSQ
jgi:FkbM family methyltransferase